MILADGTTVEIAPPDIPTLVMGAVEPATVEVVPVPGPPGSMGDVSQVRVSGSAFTTLAGHRAVTPRSDGTIEYASNTTPGHLNAPLWITSDSVSAGGTVTAVTYGWLIEPSWSWSPGAIYLGATGILTQTPPSAPAAVFLAAVGYATSPTSMFVDRQPSIQLI